MPPLDLDAIMVCRDAFSDDKEEEREDPYAPAESHRLRIREDIDWSNVGGVAVAVAVLQRNDSTKGAGANPKSAARRSVQQATPARSSTSVTAPRKVVPVLISGLPPTAETGKARCSTCRLGWRAPVFAAGEQQAVASHRRLEEPGSPKVSCLGAVRPEQRGAG